MSRQWWSRLSSAPVSAEAQGAQLPLAEGVGECSQIVGAFTHTGGHGHEDQSDHSGQGISQSLGTTELLHLGAQIMYP